MRIVHEIQSKCTVVSGDSGPESPVTITIHCPRHKGDHPWPQVRDELIEIEGHREYITEALEEALQQLKALEVANRDET